MAIAFSIDHDRRYILAIASGAISWPEVRFHLHVERLAGGLRYPELIDGRDALPTWSANQAREIVALLATFGRASEIGPTAVVVSSDLAFGMLRMLEIMLENVCIVKPFRDYEVAEQWLLDQLAAVT